MELEVQFMIKFTDFWHMQIHYDTLNILWVDDGEDDEEEDLYFSNYIALYHFFHSSIVICDCPYLLGVK